MSKFIVALLCAILLGVSMAGALRAADPTTAPTTQPMASAPVNSKCPVSGDAIDPKVTEVYEGVTYGFCCPDCIKAFNKDPQKYIAKAK